MITNLLSRTGCADVRCAAIPGRSSRRGVVTLVFRLILCGFFIGGTLAGGAMTASPVYADEFSTVPSGGALYRHLAVVTEAGWRGGPRGARSACWLSAVPSGCALYRHRAVVTEAGWRGVPQGASSTLTRYEMALKTAKAIF